MFKSQTRLTAALLLCVLSIMLTAAAPAAASSPSAVTQIEPAEALSAPTPVPTVVGPLPVSEDSYPFGAADHEMVPEDLSSVGYLEEEYLVSGTANVYSWPEPGPAIVRTPNAAYTTRMLVRRPANPAQFSGTVIVEILNPSNSFDLNIGWAMMNRQIVANGDVWVGVTGKPITIDALKNFDPVRYGSLSMANPLPLDDPMNCLDPVGSVTLPSRTTEDGLVWDIYTQVGAWVRSNAASNPLAPAEKNAKAKPVQHVYGFGYSQTGGFQFDYINAIQPLVVAADGKPMFDGYIVAVASGRFVGLVPINQCERTPASTSDPRYQFQDAGTPIIHVMSQSDYLFGVSLRRPDGDTYPDLYRHYEMAGAAHATPDELFYSAAPEDILKAGRAVPPMECNEGPRSRFPSHIFFDSFLQNLKAWVEDGVAPPHSDPIVVENGQPVLDAFGNVTGGLRSPFLDVPTSTWYGSSTGASFCFIAGHEVPFSEAQLLELYPNHGSYVNQVARNISDLVRDRFITRSDGSALMTDAAHSDVP
ncbi:MAG: alpha/beta hydrolase domain-containing protein [Anaerolineales bacterium]